MSSPRPAPEPGATAPDGSPVDWALAERIACSVARRPGATRKLDAHRSGAPWGATIDPSDLVGMADIATERVAAVTGLASPLPATLQVVDREAWIAANIRSFQRLLAPLLDRWAARTATRRALAGPTRRIAAAELGALLGWMSRRVLGQYDLLVGADGDGTADDAVYLVGPNIIALEQRHGFPPDQFRLWVTTHELTHRAQFTGVPWMRGHFLDLVHESLALADPDPAVLGAAVRDVLRDRGELRRRMADGGLVAVVASPEQRAVLGRISGMMSLLEGHGDVTMDRAVADLVPSAERFGAVLRARRAKGNPLAKLIQRLVGLEAKLGQYVAGEQFIAAVESELGPGGIELCWRGPADLPTLDEIRAPRLWLERVGGQLATTV